MKTDSSTPSQETKINKKNTGKIFKGAIKDAPSKLKVSSIPSKYQNVVYRNNKIPAFGNSKQRFYNPSQIHFNNPGPGQYVSIQKQQNKIYPKKGFGPLINRSKLQRLSSVKNKFPGPGSYQPKLSISAKYQKSKSLALISSKNQGHQLFKNEIKKSYFTPGPGRYNIRINRSQSQGHVIEKRIERFQSSINVQQVPPIGYYNTTYNNNSTHCKVFYQPKNSKNLKLFQERKIQLVQNIMNYSNKIDITQKLDVGPGTYNTITKNKTIGFKITQSNKDRFGNPYTDEVNHLNKNKSNNFKLQNQQQTEQNDTIHRQGRALLYQQKSSLLNKGITSVFKSNLQRYNFVDKNINDPTKYSPTKYDKVSYLINFTNKWV